jgi:hypothetical protein
VRDADVGIRRLNRIGRRQGCVAVGRAAIGAVLALLGPGSLLYAGKVTDA